MNLRSIDLNLLLVFDAIAAEGNQTRAANKLGMSQPAMSNALTRLRAALDDPLFLRTTQGMVPTPRARQLIAPVRQALDLIQGGLKQARRKDYFDCSASTRTIVFSVEDYGDTVIVPRFIDWLTQVAPSMSLRVLREPSSMTLSKKLSDGSLDMAIRYLRPGDGDLRTRQLMMDEFVCLVRHDHPQVGDNLTLNQYLSLSHVVYGRLGRKGAGSSAVDRALERLGASRKILLQVPGFHSMPAVVRDTDLICTLPRRLAMTYAHAFHLRVLRPPLELPLLPVYLVWNRSIERDPAHEWIRNSVYELCQRL